MPFASDRLTASWLTGAVIGIAGLFLLPELFSQYVKDKSNKNNRTIFLLIIGKANQKSSHLLRETQEECTRDCSEG